MLCKLCKLYLSYVSCYVSLLKVSYVILCKLTVDINVFVEYIKLYITHKNIPVILLVNTTSRDIKYYAYIPNI